MRFIGLDLAWGDNARTGLCAVSADGVVLASTSLVTTEEIAAWCEANMGSDGVILAVDAPLVVTNASGRRPCEKVISRCYGARHASAHSSNTSRREFIDGSRALRLARRLELDIDPVITPGVATSRMIEVYPHPAIVTLFQLASSLPYKAKKGRTTDTRRAVFSQLMDLLEGLKTVWPQLDVTTTTRWTELRSCIEASNATGVSLDVVEDELDAYVCAYVALYYWTHGNAKNRVVGDLATGYIVTPVTDLDATFIDLLVTTAA